MFVKTRWTPTTYVAGLAETREYRTPRGGFTDFVQTDGTTIRVHHEQARRGHRQLPFCQRWPAGVPRFMTGQPVTATVVPDGDVHDWTPVFRRGAARAAGVL